MIHDLTSFFVVAAVVVSSFLTVTLAFDASLAHGGMRMRNPRTTALAALQDHGAPRLSSSWEPNLPPPISGSAAPSSRRQAAHTTLVALISMTTAVAVQHPSEAVAAESADDGSNNMFAPGFVQRYSDFEEGAGGYSYRDVTIGRDEGNGPAAAKGDRVVYDWSGYTIGYFGRPFQAKGGPQGGAFDKDLDYSRAVLGSGTIVKGLEAAMIGMRPGGVRQVIIPYGDLSYPADDPSHDRVGPKPSTFSGDRALNFVLENPRLDRTLLFNIKVVRVDKPNGKGGFIRG